MEFPEDVIFETFSNFPAKDLFNYSSVSKGCKRLADEDVFVKKQCHNMQKKGDSGFFIEPDYVQTYQSDKLELHSVVDDDKAAIPSTAQEFLLGTSRILASSNGLLCCRVVTGPKKGTLLLCNPLTQTWLPIPSPSGLNPSSEYHIVFDCNNISGSKNFPNDYLLMIIMFDDDEEEFNWESDHVWKIYSPEEGIWKNRGRINFGPREINYEMSVYQNSTVYFITDCFDYTKTSPYIVSLNVKDGTQKLFGIPKNSSKCQEDEPCSCKFDIFKWGSYIGGSESICLVEVRRKKWYVWVREDHDKNLWNRRLKKRVQDMGFIEYDPKFAGFTVFNGSLLLLATEERVYGYNLASDDQENEKVKLISGHTCGRNVFFRSYSSTLRPVGMAQNSNIVPSLSTFP